MRGSVMALGLLVLAGCGGGSDATGPSDAQIGGTWTARWSNMNSPGFGCNVGTTTMIITQTGTTFTGTYSGAQLQCNTLPPGPPASGRIVNGTINGQQVTFDLNDQNLHQTGTVSGSSMSGSATWTASLNGQPFTLNGTWSASK